MAVQQLLGGTDVGQLELLIWEDFLRRKSQKYPLATSTNRISDGFDGERNVKQVVFWPVGHKVGVVLIMFRQSEISNDDGFLFGTSWKILVKTIDFWVF